MQIKEKAAIKTRERGRVVKKEKAILKKSAVASKDSAVARK